MKIAVLANRFSGSGRTAELLKTVRRAWGTHELIGAAGYGGELLPVCRSEVLPEGYVAGIEAAALALAAEEPDFLTVIGGDGTAAYAAEALLSAGRDIPLFGIAAGTANVGPIISHPGDAPLPSPEKLRLLRFGAMEAKRSDGGHLAYGFNDLVLGNTFLGTKNGETRTFSAKALVRDGVLTEEKPLNSLAGKNGLCFQIDGEPLPALPFGAAQLIAGPLKTEQFYGKAVTGVLCYTPGSPMGAAVYLSPTPVVSCEDGPEGFSAWFTGAQLLLGPDSLLSVSGLAEAVSLIADGNPYLLQENTVGLCYVPDCISVLQEEPHDGTRE